MNLELTRGQSGAAKTVSSRVTMSLSVTERWSGQCAGAKINTYVNNDNESVIIPALEK